MGWIEAGGMRMEAMGNCDEGDVGGRPFVVDGAMRLAALEPRDDWNCALAPALCELDAATRAEIGGWWARLAATEHASIASFARFVLDLLAVGAPADLVASAQRAMADEVVHARLCYGLASAYLGTPIGPGPLPVAGAVTGETTIASLVRATIEEGCVGETIAAAQAEHARLGCTDPAALRVLRVIARDERRHAQLGWRFLAWALLREPSVRAHVDAAFTTAIADLCRDRAAARPLEDGARDPRRAHGLVPAQERALLLRTVVAEVLEPCVRALLDGAASEGGELTIPPPALAASI